MTESEQLGDVRGEIQALADHAAAEHHAPALVWGVMLERQLALSGHSGALDGGSAPTARTAFRIASMTKTFTAAVVLRLRDDGVLSLDDPLEELPARPTTDSPPITMRHLLTMQSGLTSDDPWADRHLDISPEALDAVLAAGPAFAMPPGIGYEYSNLGFGLIGRVVERLTGERVQTLVDHSIIEPLGLERTTWTQPDHSEWAWPYRIEDGQPVRDDLPIGDGALAPMGGLWSTVEDIVKVMAWFEDAFPPRDAPDDDPIKRATRREQQQLHRMAGIDHRAASGQGPEHVPERTDAMGYGFGVQVVHDQRFGHIVGHSGGLPGYGSNMRWLPGRRAGAVGLANSTYAPMRLLTRRILEVLDDHHLVPPPAVSVPAQLQTAGESLVRLLNEWNDVEADDLFEANASADESYERRARAARDVTGEHGPLALERIDASLATDATAIARAEDGTEVHVWLALSPGGRIQEYSIDVSST